MRHQEVLVGMLCQGKSLHGHFLIAPVLEVYRELRGDTHHVERPLEPSFGKVYLVHGRHRDGFTARIVRGEVEAVYCSFKAFRLLCIAAEEAG